MSTDIRPDDTTIRLMRKRLFSSLMLDTVSVLAALAAVGASAFLPDPSRTTVRATALVVYLVVQAIAAWFKISAVNLRDKLPPRAEVVETPPSTVPDQRRIMELAVKTIRVVSDRTLRAAEKSEEVA